MGSERVRVVGLAVASIALLLVTSFAMDWFVQHIGPNVTSYTLLGGRECVPNMPCRHVSLPKDDMFTRNAPATVWGSLVIVLLVAAQAGFRLVSGSAQARLTKTGYLLTISMLGTAFFNGYIFVPELPKGSDVYALGTVSMDRTWAPLLAVLAYVLATVSLYFSSHEGSAFEGQGEYKPIVIDKNAAKSPATMPTPRPAAPMQDGRSRGKVRFATANADISRAGIDAVREDDSAVLVAWRDITRVFARRLPHAVPYDGATVIDLVSKSGATIRVVPWTKLTGETFDSDSDARARAFVQLVASRCANATLDPATKSFATGTAPATQLPDAAALAAHDDAIA